LGDDTDLLRLLTLALSGANNVDEFSARKDYINNLLDNEPEIVQSVSDFFSNADMINELKTASKFTLSHLTENKILSIEALESYYKFSKFRNDYRLLFNHKFIRIGIIYCIFAYFTRRLYQGMIYIYIYIYIQ
jgi:hypothetical protein